MYKISISIDDDLYDKLTKYMKVKKIKNRSKAIGECIDLVTSGFDMQLLIIDTHELVKEIRNRVITQRKLTEQFFANHGFQENDDVSSDESLTNFYKEKRGSIYKFLD